MVRIRTLFAVVAATLLMTGCVRELESGDALHTVQRTFTAGLSDDAGTRVYADLNYRLKWHANDSIAIFANSSRALYRFDGNTGDNIGTFSYVSGASIHAASVVAVYPSEAAVSANASGVVSVTYPASQVYSVGTFGRKSAIMVAATSGPVDDNLKFHCAGSFLIVKLFGSDYVRSISVKGNSGEALAGPASLTIGQDGKPSVAMASSASPEVTLDCGGIPIGATEAEATEFWISLPPCRFEAGFTVEVTNGAGEKAARSTAKTVDLPAGKVQPMAPFELSLSGGKSFTSFSLSPQGSANKYQAFDLSEGYLTIYAPWGSEQALVANFEVPAGSTVFVDGVEQQSGVTVNDFTSPLYYTLKTAGNGQETYKVTVVPVELPVMFVNTPQASPVKSKVEWTYGTQIFIQNIDGTVTAYTEMGDQNLGNAIRGRGNSSWNFAKKPYAIKLAKKADMLGIMTGKGKKKGHKRWCLLANWRDRTLVRNDITARIADLLPGLEWTPSGKFVELVLNGSFDNTYYLCEQIKIDANRLAIDELEEGEVGGLKMTGGYLLECDTYSDETIYRSAVRNLPVKFKSPDTEDWTDKTEYASLTTYMMNWLGDVEKILSGTDRTRDYSDYMDVDSFVDYWILNELVQNIEAVNGPRSCYMYKKRDVSETQIGKLYAGPIWDYDCETFHKAAAYSGDKVRDWNRIQLWYLKTGDKTGDHYYRDRSQSTAALYYGYLFNDEAFRKKVIERWNEAYPALCTVPDYITSICSSILRSAERNAEKWPINLTRNGDENLSVEAADAMLIQVYKDRLDWMNKSINSPDFCVAK